MSKVNVSMRYWIMWMGKLLEPQNYSITRSIDPWSSLDHIDSWYAMKKKKCENQPQINLHVDQKNSMHITTDIPHFWRQTGQNILQKLENLEKKSWIINSLYQILALSEEIKMGSTPKQLQLNSIFWLEGLSLTESEKQVRRDLNLSAPE